MIWRRKFLKFLCKEMSLASMSGPAALFENPQYATPVGLIRYAQLLEEQRPRAGGIGGLFGRIFGGK